jgi:hypothetical protein
MRTVKRTVKFRIEIEKGNDQELILISIEDDAGLKTVALEVRQVEHLADLLTIAVSIARGK